ncbi:MAG: hypothetical protein RLZ98_1555 [Pseudomonadota bacterium]|jgi:uncharacterized membrane protein YhaH (DUF805 family)
MAESPVKGDGPGANAMNRMSLIQFFFSFRGRITRFEWWLGCGILTALTVLAIRIIEPNLLLTVEDQEEVPKPPSLGLTIWNVLICYPSAAMSIKRFNDRDLPIWTGYVLGILLVAMQIANYHGYLLDPRTMDGFERLMFFSILVYSLWAVYDNGFLRGTKGRNRHGFDPLYR